MFRGNDEPRASTPSLRSSKALSRGSLSSKSAPSLFDNGDQNNVDILPLWDGDGVAMQGMMAKLPMSVNVVAAKKEKEDELKGMAAESESHSGSKLKKAVRSRWQRRFFQLRNGVLSYYDCTEMTIGHDGAEPADAEAKGMELTHCKVLQNDVKPMWADLNAAKKKEKAAKKKAKEDKKRAKELGKGIKLKSKLWTKKTLAALSAEKFDHFRFSISRPPLNLSIGCRDETELQEWKTAVERVSLMRRAQPSKVVATNDANALPSATQKVLYEGWLLKKGAQSYAGFKGRYIVYNAAGEIKYYKKGGESNDLGSPLGVINTADSLVVRWSQDSVANPHQYPSPQCLEIKMKDRVWKFCPFQDSKESSQWAHVREAAKKDLVRFHRVITEHIKGHKDVHSAIAKLALNERTELKETTDSVMKSFVRGTGMTNYQRVTGNVPPSYLSYSSESAKLFAEEEKASISSTTSDVESPAISPVRSESNPASSSEIQRKESFGIGNNDLGAF